MDKIKNIPELRFPQFAEEWNEKKFGKLYTFKPTNSFSRDMLNYESGSLKNIHYGDIHTKFSLLFDIEKEEVPFVNSNIKITGIADDNYVQEGDLILADASEDYNDIGKSIEIVNLNNEKVLSGLHTILSRRKTNELAPGFMAFLMKSYKVRLEIMRIAQGTKVLGLSSKRLAEIPLWTPKKEEQKKIATFLTAIDKRISLLTQQKEQLELYKKGLMQKIFSRELRFKDENGKDFPEWEEKRLGEIALKKASNISANNLIGNSGKYKIYGATGFLQLVDFYKEKEAYISIIKDGAGVGRLFLCEAKTSVLGTLDVINTKDNNDLLFLYFLLSTIDFTKFITGSTIPHIYFKDYSKVKLKVPTIDEQKKIASYLTAINRQIENVISLIDDSINYKKGLLQKLFI
jgi:type I restriction enzyme S subunit